MGTTRLIAMGALLLAAGANCVAAEPQLHKFSYCEGFEGKAPRVDLWAHNGESAVNFLGPTGQRAFEGKKAFKLEVVLKSGSYHYQHGFGHVWNDFDDPTYRDHVFAYPTFDGVIDTLQWEGFREGIDDVRYLTTLVQRIEQAKTDPAKQRLAKEAEQWVATIDVAADLDGLRGKTVEWILRLSRP
jgi:hypothetical protein